MKKEILQKFPLRIAINDQCNLRCFFCSNEGMARASYGNIDVEKFKKLVNILSQEGLKNISLTGGEPSLHPQVKDIITFCGDLDLENIFFHTNGTLLDERIISLISSNFTKIALSIHAVERETWKKITGGGEEQFDSLMEKLSILSFFSEKILVEVKYVPMKGVNDDKKNISRFLDFCNENRFKFKFLNLEPITTEQLSFVVPFEELKKTMVECGARKREKEKVFRGQGTYLPIERFDYGNTFGVAIEIGCGKEITCNNCHKSNEIFVTPGLEIKPCHVTDNVIDLNYFLEKGDENSVLEAIIESRNYLASSPGKGAETWQSK